MKEGQAVQTKPVRSDKGRPQLTPRDDAILRQIGEQTGYRFDQLQALLARHPESDAHDPAFLSESRTFALIQRWKKLGLAAYDKIYYHDPGWIWLTQKGLSHVHLSVRFLDLYHADLDHLFWINEMRAFIEAHNGSRPGFQWESERQYRATRERLKRQVKQEPDLWIPREYRGTHRPDAVVRYRRKDDPDAPIIVSAIEVELSEKDYATWKKIFLDLTSFFTNAYYYVDSSVKSQLTHALKKFQEEDPLFGEPTTERRQFIFIHDLEQCF